MVFAGSLAVRGGVGAAFFAAGNGFRATCYADICRFCAACAFSNDGSGRTLPPGKLRNGRKVLSGIVRVLCRFPRFGKTGRIAAYPLPHPTQRADVPSVYVRRDEPHVLRGIAGGTARAAGRMAAASCPLAVCTGNGVDLCRGLPTKAAKGSACRNASPLCCRKNCARQNAADLLTRSHLRSSAITAVSSGSNGGLRRGCRCTAGTGTAALSRMDSRPSRIVIPSVGCVGGGRWYILPCRACPAPLDNMRPLQLRRVEHLASKSPVCR